MASLTTLFVVGPNEYVEFNESWGSRAFLDHIWDQSQTPLQQQDLAPRHLHSAGARISNSTPPRIEFPVIRRLRGKGSTYKPTGKWITWDDLAQRNPLAVRPPPSLDDFIAAGATVGTGPKLKPGELASKLDPVHRITSTSSTSSTAKSPIMPNTKTPVMDLETDDDGWIGGSSQSIYAPSSASSPPPSKPTSTPSPVTPERQSSQTADGVYAGSLLQRIEMAHNFQTPPPKPRDGHVDSNRSSRPSSTPSPASNVDPSTSPFRTTPSQGIRRPGAKIPSPLPLTSPARNNGPASPLNTRTPLSASHPIPETPLKLSQRGGPQTPATPHYPTHPHSAHTHSQDTEAARASGLGLGLTPLKSSVPLAPSPDTLRSPLNEALHLRGRAASNASVGSPLKAGRSDLHGEPLAFGASGSNNRASNSQVDAMLERLRNTRSGLGTSASIWAPKSASATESVASTSSSTTTTHTIGSGFASSNLLGVQTGLDRKRPSHRPNGLQLSLGQEISVMQELEEKAEEESAPSTLSSAAAGETFRIDPPDHGVEKADQDGWHGHVVPPTPAMGCDLSSEDDDDHAAAAKAPPRGLDAFGWGAEARKSSFFSKLPSSSALEANWSGDDDDDRKDDVQVFEEMQSRAKASSKEKRNSSYSPLPPPSINWAKPRTPSPTHSLLAKSPQLDGLADHVSGSRGGVASPSLSAPKFGTSSGAIDSEGHSQQRLSPASARSPLPVSEDSDADADAEAEKPNRRRAAKKPDASAKPRSVQGEDDAKADSTLHEGGGGLEKKRSLKRDKSERIRGRRASQSKEKDVDKGRLSASSSVPTAATVSLPTSTLHKKTTDGLAEAVENVSITEEDMLSNADCAVEQTPTSSTAAATVRRTPVAHRVQSIPTIKDDLFSSPAEPKVELPGTSAIEEKEVVSAGEISAETKVDENMTPSPAQTPESSHQKTMSLDWAADDDELDDELPDLGDWGVTLNPAKSQLDASSAADVAGSKGAAEKASRNGNRNGHGKKESESGDGGDKVWRRGTSMSDAVHKGKKHRAAAEEKSTKVKGASGKELFLRSTKGSSSKGINGAGGPLGIRIAGRAKDASLSPEPESNPTVADQKKLPPPASTPYGRWKKPAPATSVEEISIKGSSTRKTAAAPPSARPRIAADLGALAKLLTPVEENSTPVTKEQQAGRGAKGGKSSSLALEDKKVGKKKSPTVANSVHAPPSVADSLDAPTNHVVQPSSADAPSAMPTTSRNTAKKSHAHHHNHHHSAKK